MRTVSLLIVIASLLFSPVHAAEDASLAAIIEARSAEDRARDVYRHPQTTIEFFGLQPGMTVGEALPGGGWYSRILAEWLGPHGTLYGVNYVDEMWAMFGFMSPEVIEKRIASAAQFAQQVAGWTDNGITAAGFTFATVPQEIAGKLDAFLLIRALHNLNRFEAQAGTRSQALAAIHSMLKDGGIVGVVQHRAPDSASDEWADGSRGYLKQDAVIASFEAAGFELVDTAEINANPADKPGEDDIVWRLPPSFNGTRDDPAKKAAVAAIGESDRMTLLFRKVAATPG